MEQNNTTYEVHRVDSDGELIEVAETADNEEDAQVMADAINCGPHGAGKVVEVNDNTGGETDDDNNVPVQVGDEFDAMGETVEITNERNGELCVYYHDREPVEGTAYTAWRPRESVEAVAAREDWTRLNTDEDTDDDGDTGGKVEWVETPRCPQCGSFMSQDTDGYGLPAAQCSQIDCDGWFDDRGLIERGVVEV